MRSISNRNTRCDSINNNNIVLIVAAATAAPVNLWSVACELYVIIEEAKKKNLRTERSVDNDTPVASRS